MWWSHYCRKISDMVFCHRPNNPLNPTQLHVDTCGASWYHVLTYFTERQEPWNCHGHLNMFDNFCHSWTFPCHVQGTKPVSFQVIANAPAFPIPHDLQDGGHFAMITAGKQCTGMCSSILGSLIFDTSCYETCAVNERKMCIGKGMLLNQKRFDWCNSAYSKRHHLWKWCMQSIATV